jgi:hypothetical protein
MRRNSTPASHPSQRCPSQDPDDCAWGLTFWLWDTELLPEEVDCELPDDPVELDPAELDPVELDPEVDPVEPDVPLEEVPVLAELAPTIWCQSASEATPVAARLLRPTTAVMVVASFFPLDRMLMSRPACLDQCRIFNDPACFFETS